MSTVNKCDRCGKLQAWEHWTKVTIATMPPGGINESSISVWDLCVPCKDAVVRSKINWPDDVRKEQESQE